MSSHLPCKVCLVLMPTIIRHKAGILLLLAIRMRRKGCSWDGDPSSRALCVSVLTPVCPHVGRWLRRQPWGAGGRNAVLLE